jgi:putative membrane protein
MGPQFVAEAAQGGMTEVELSKVALNKGSNADVKQFANMMIQDHTKANTELESIAKSKGMRISPSLDAEHSSIVTTISSKSGKAFDQAYVQQMAADHDKTINLFQNEANDTDKDFAPFAAKTLPVLQGHKEMVASLASKMH